MQPSKAVHGDGRVDPWCVVSWLLQSWACPYIHNSQSNSTQRSASTEADSSIMYGAVSDLMCQAVEH